MSDCYARLGFVVHAKRYLMLTLVEDALRERGVNTPKTSGVYFQLVWRQRLADQELRRYAVRFQELAQEMPRHRGTCIAGKGRQLVNIAGVLAPRDALHDLAPNAVKLARIVRQHYMRFWPGSMPITGVLRN